MGSITGFNQGKFKSAEYIYAKIKREFKSFGGVNLIDDADFPLYTAEVLKRLGVSAYKEEDALLKVKHGKAKLPDDFMYLYSAYLCGNCTFNSTAKNFQTETLFENDITCEVLKRSKECTMEFDCATQGDKIIERIRIKQYIHDQWDTYEYDRPRLLSLSPNVKDRCTEDCLNFFRHNCKDEITIDNKRILANFDEGTIYMQYYAFPQDEEGLPMIPDVIEIEKAVEWYIKNQILLNFWFSDDLTNAQNKWQKAEQEFEKWFAEAKYICKLPSFAGMINTLKNTRGINKVSFFSQMDNKR